MEHSSVFHGEVEKGIGLGKKLGFPTFNLHVDPLPDIPHGVYAVRALVSTGLDDRTSHAYNALMHYGPKPSVNMMDVFCEVYLLGFADDFEVREMEVRVLGKIRDVIKFESLDALVEQMKGDEEVAVEHYFNV